VVAVLSVEAGVEWEDMLCCGTDLFLYAHSSRGYRALIR